MRRLPSLKRYPILVLVSLVTVVMLILSPALAHAQSQVIEQTQVSATVLDSGPPTTPILIAPCNNCYVTSSLPYFVWEASTDSNGIDHYRLTLDGLTHFDNIPTSDTDNSNYTLTYNSGNSRYTLAPKINISDGTHTWKIGAYDTVGNLTESATWSFTIDTQAPAFVLTQIGDQTVSISAQDSGTIPTQPVVLGANEPLLAATGEASSTVQLTVIIPGDPTQNYTTAISSGGNWTHQLGILPRDVVMTLNFVITDVAGNISVLNGVEFIIPTEVIVIPGSPTPSPSPSPSASAETTPGSTPQPAASPGETASPTPSPGLPSIEIPILPPREIANELLQETLERLPGFTEFTQALNPAVREVLQEIPRALAPVSAVVVAAAIPAVSTLALALQFGAQISPELFVKILQTVGLIPAGKPQGLVYEGKSHQPVAFALLTISSVDTSQSISETVVSDVNGIYKGIQLPPGKYRLVVTHQDYTFPTAIKRPRYLQMADYYQGEVFQVTSEKQQQFFLIPVDKKEAVMNRTILSRLRIWLARLSRRTNALIFPLFFISAFLAVLFPTIWNWAMSGLYTLLAGRKMLAWFRNPSLVGKVVDSQGDPLSEVIIRLRLSDHDELTQLVTTDKKGSFQLFVPPGKYQLAVNKQGYVWYENQPILSFYEVAIGKETLKMVIVMQSTELLYQQLFSE